MTKNYNEDSIQRHAGLLGLRKRPSMYIGPTDSSGLWTIIRETLDNQADLITKGLAKKINSNLIFDPNKYAFWVVDDGPGIPVGKKTFLDEKGNKEVLSTLFVTTGLMHGGSNFDTDTNSRGVNGIGQKAANAMSKVFKVWTFRDGKWYSIYYKDAKLFKDVALEKPPKLPFGVKAKQGTIIYVEPDLSLFEKSSKVELSAINEWCTVTTVLVPNITINVYKNGKSKTYKSGNINDYLETRLKDCGATPYGKPFVHHSDNMDIALFFANAENNELMAYTNGLHNVDGGEHVKIVQDAISKSLKPYAGKKDDYKSSDLYEGIVGIVNAKIAAPKFNTQVKAKLIDDRLKLAVKDKVLKSFEDFWKKNKSLAKDVIRRAVTLRKKTDEFLHDKKLIKNVEGAKKKLSSKLADVSGSKIPFADRELLLVEGDSAGGGSKRARNKSTQAVLPLRGKPLNVMEATSDKIQANEEFVTLFAAMGVDLKSDRPFDNLRYGKIIFVADPDVDGPLEANTKVHLVDGSNPTIKEVHNRFNAGEKLFVWANNNGKFQPAQIKNTIKTTQTSYLKIKLDDGTVLRMTKKHRQFINGKNGLEEIPAAALKVGDSIPCMYLLKRYADGYQYGNYLTTSEYYQPGVDKIVAARGQARDFDIYGNMLKVPERLHVIAARYFFPKQYKKYIKHNKTAKAGEHMHIHHIDEYVQNNNHDNLQFVMGNVHYAHHCRENLLKYNGSKQHIRAIRKSNRNPEYNEIRLLGHCARYYVQLKLEFGKITKNNWNANLKRTTNSVPFFENLIFSKKEIAQYVKENALYSADIKKLRTVTKIAKIDRKRTYNRNHQWYLNTIQDLKDRGLPKTYLGLETLRKENKNNNRRTLSYTTFKKFSELKSNHKIVKIIEVKETRDFYCLEVPETGNFYIHDKQGNALLTGNCHITTLLLAMLYRFAKPLIKAGKVFTVNCPEYMAKYKGKSYFGFTVDEIYKQTGTNKVDITHLKGLGECNEVDLKTIAIDPATRSLTQFVYPKTEKERKDFEALMGRDSTYRKQLLGVR